MIALLIGSIFEGNRIEQEQAAAKQQPVNRRNGLFGSTPRMDKQQKRSRPKR
ncbi:hypothetical protein MT997_22315 [Paenibacillus sp. OVF10]|nr:hypothetical protein MT997_22315 [Paenibacillus sp. OVF10]